MKPIVAALSLPFVAAIALAPVPAMAADFKNYTPSVCQPYSATTLSSDLSFRAHGLKNISASAEYVVCSILEDMDSFSNRWTNVQSGIVYVMVHAPTNTTARCELYLGSNLAGASKAYYVDQVLGGGVRSLDFRNVNADGVDYPTIDDLIEDVPVSLFCRIPPGASILQIVVGEKGITD